MPEYGGNLEGKHQRWINDSSNPGAKKPVETPAQAFPSPERLDKAGVQPNGAVPFGSRAGLGDKTNVFGPLSSLVVSKLTAHAESENGVASGLPSQPILFTPPTSPPSPKHISGMVLLISI